MPISKGRWQQSRLQRGMSKPDRSQLQGPGVATLLQQFVRGLTLHQQGKLLDAERIYQEILLSEPRHFDALHLLGVIALQTGRNEHGVDLIAQALEVDPSAAAAHSNLGNGLRRLGRYEDALASYDMAIALKPNTAEAHNNRGNVLDNLKRHLEAVRSFDRAIALNPKYVEAYNNRGVALNNLHRHEEAVASYDKAIALKPDFAEAHNNRGIALNDLNRRDEALSSFDRAIALNPGYANAHNNRGNVLKQLKRYGEAVASFDKAARLQPDLVGVEGKRLYAKMQICDWRNFDSERTNLLSAVRNGKKNADPFSILGISSSPEDQLKCATLWITKQRSASDRPIWRGEIYKHKRIRIAYLSADFRDHPLSYLMAGIFERHDRRRFETIAVSYGPNGRSDMRERLEAAFDRFIDVTNMDDAHVAGLLRTLEIDIAVDLTGYTAGARTEIVAYRAAPIQVSYLGYPGTMGADYIDYIVADRIVIPVSHQLHYTEKIAYMPNSYWANDLLLRISDRMYTRADFGLPSKGFVFCCFNNNYKITPRVFDSWMRILERVKGGILWIFEGNATVAANLRKEAEARGVDPKRLVFAQPMSRPDHLARHRLADLFLDTLPYNAHTTASDALWTGLPVLTQIGGAFAGRVAASLLNAIDVPELVTSTPQAYEALAVELATDPPKLAGIKQKLAANRRTSPLFNTELFTRHMEAAYIAMYGRYQSGLPPDHIYIEQ